MPFSLLFFLFVPLGSFSENCCLMLSEPMIFNMTAARETLLESRRRVVVVHPAAKADCIAAKLTFFFFFIRLLSGNSSGRLRKFALMRSLRSKNTLRDEYIKEGFFFFPPPENNILETDV